MEYIEFDGKKSSDIGGKRGLRVISWTRDTLPEIRDELKSVEGRPGSILHEREPGNRNVSVTLRAFFDDEVGRVGVLNEMSKWLLTDGMNKIVFSDEPDVYYMGKVMDKTEYEPDFFMVDVTIEFTCHPFKYGSRRNINIDTTPSGTTFNNTGTAKSAPYIEATIKEQMSTSDVSDFTMNMNGYEITYNGIVGDGDTIIVDTENMEFLYNDEIKILEISGWFPEVVHGENTIDTSINATVTISWQEMNV